MEYKTISRDTSDLLVLSNPAGKKHVALLVGGMSAEREVSLMSGKSASDALVSLGYRVTQIDMGADIASVLQVLKPDVVFNCLHGTYGEDGALQGMLNILHIPYTHSGLLASAIAFNKEASHQLFAYNDIQHINSVTVHKSQKLLDSPIPKPYVIKPIAQGSSIGVEIILESSNFNFADYTFPYGDKVLIQRYIKGQELQVAVLNGKALGVLELRFINGKWFYDYEAKYVDGFTEHLIPASVDDKVSQRAMSISQRLYELLGCNGIIRVEFIYDASSDELYVLELNTHPGMTALSICPEIAAYHGINFTQFVELVLSTARYEI